MNFILIDPQDRTVIDIKLLQNEEPSLAFYQGLVGGLVEVAHAIDEKNEIIVNEEGLLNNPQAFFEYEGAHQPFAGKGLVVGVEETSEGSKWCGTLLSRDQVKAKVKFATLAELKLRYALEKD